MQSQVDVSVRCGGVAGAVPLHRHNRQQYRSKAQMHMKNKTYLNLKYINMKN